MAEIFFPQLGTGVVAQYPIRKSRFFRTIKNILPDGRMILLPDTSAGRLQWELNYSNISGNDAEALQAHFRICNGPFRRFTFLDPTENLLSFSCDFDATVWLKGNSIQVENAISDPLGGQQGFRLTNNSQASADLYQILAIPTSFFYCLSVYVRTSATSQLSLFRRGQNDNHRETYASKPYWTRVSLRGALAEQTSTLSTGLTLAPGQQVEVFGIQLEAQLAASEYRPTNLKGGVHSNAHLGMEELVLTAEGPDSYSTTVFVESAEQ